MKAAILATLGVLSYFVMLLLWTAVLLAVLAGGLGLLFWAGGQ